MLSLLLPGADPNTGGLFCGEYPVHLWAKGEPTSELEPLTCSLRVNCSYWTILCFTLLNNRRYQRERRSVTRCNECLVVSVLVFERIGESTGNVFAGDLTPLPELLGRLYGARAIILGQAARTDDGVVEATALQTFAGAGLGAEIRTHRLRAPLRVAHANRAKHQVAAHPTLLRSLDQLGGPAVVHRLLALGPTPRSGASREDDGVAPLDRPPDSPSDLLGFQVDHHRLGAVRLDIACLLLLADESPDLVAIFGQHPYQTPRCLAVRASDQNPHETTSFEPGLPWSLQRIEEGSTLPQSALVSKSARRFAALSTSAESKHRLRRGRVRGMFPHDGARPPRGRG